MKQSQRRWSVTNMSKLLTWEEAAALPINSPDRYGAVPADQKEIVTRWIKKNILPRKTPLNEHTSYGLKHIFEWSDTGFYMTNGEFKGAMIASGFEPVKEDLNCNYRISKKSPAFDFYRPGYDQTKGIR